MRAEAESAIADQERVGNYVRGRLPKLIAKAGCEWRVQVDWDDVEVRGYLLRGELVISTFHRRVPWWIPTEKWKANAIAEDLAAVLLRWWTKYRDADETGWRYRVMWQDEGGVLYDERQETGRAVTVHLAPGVRFGLSNGGGLTLLYRLGEHCGLGLQDGEVLGWIRVD